MQKKGVISYLIITFGVTYLVEGIAIALGMRIEKLPSITWQYIVMGVMWVPAIATILTCKFITKESIRETTGLRFGNWKYYLVIWFIIPLGFVLTYLITWLTGLGQPDWQLTELFKLAAAFDAPMENAPSPELITLGIVISSLFAAVWFNSIIAFGEEWGWRGYLLPRLMPLGKWKAYLLMGIIWGLWHAPLIAVGFNYGSYNLVGIVVFCALTFSISLVINEFSLITKSSIISAWAHGVFNSQAYGIWRQIFPTVNPILGGFSGLIGIAVWLIIGMLTVRYFKRKTLQTI